MKIDFKILSVRVQIVVDGLVQTFDVEIPGTEVPLPQSEFKLPVPPASQPPATQPDTPKLPHRKGGRREDITVAMVKQLRVQRLTLNQMQVKLGCSLTCLKQRLEQLYLQQPGLRKLKSVPAPRKGSRLQTKPVAAYRETTEWVQPGSAQCPPLYSMPGVPDSDTPPDFVESK